MDDNYRPGYCSFCHAGTWVEERSDGSLQCRGCKAVGFFQWMYRPLGFSLLRWQAKELRALYGTVNADTGLRRYRKGYIEIPKKNGKTFLDGGLPIYHLVAEKVRNPEGYGGASTKEQAGLVFKAAVELIDANPALQKKLRILKSSKRIMLRDDSGYYQVVSGDGKGASGVEPSLLIIDELHRWSGQRAETLWQELWKGRISREEPLGIMTTTAGSEDESLLWNAERDFARGVLSGEFEVPSYYASIYQANEERVREDPDYWRSREARVEANPSHEDNGGFLKDEAILEELDEARKKGGGEQEYKRYHLGIRASGSGQEAVINIEQWIRGNEASEVDLRTWPEYDPEFLIRKWGLMEKPAVVGIDASWSIDLSCVSVVFPPTWDPIWRVLLFFFMPEAAIARRKQTDQVPYDAWARKGFIKACKGNSVDYEDIKQRVRWANEMFDVRENGYDPWNFRATAGDLEREGIIMTEIRQSYSQLSEPTKELIAAYLDNRIWHGNNPVMNFCARSLSLDNDSNGNVRPAKPNTLKSKKRIDGIAATVNGMARGLTMVETGCDLDSFLSSPIRA